MPERLLIPTCVRCGSDAVIPDAFLGAKDLTSALRLQVGVYTKPEALMMKGPVRTDVRVQVCGDCGFIETFASDPRALWEAYVQRLSREFGS